VGKHPSGVSPPALQEVLLIYTRMLGDMAGAEEDLMLIDG